MQDIQKFVNAVSRTGEEHEIFLTDGSRITVSAKSLLGVIYAMEWAEVYCFSETPIGDIIFPWLID